MSFEIIFERCISIEAQLDKLGAEGKSLYQKVNSIEYKLDPDIVKTLRFINHIRNKKGHELNFKVSDDALANYISACDEVDSYLLKIKEGHSADWSYNNQSSSNNNQSSSSFTSCDTLEDWHLSGSEYSGEQTLWTKFKNASLLGKVGLVATGLTTIAVCIKLSDK